MLKKILIGMGIVVAAILLMAALSPADFKIERSTVIAAPAAAVFPYINNPRLTEEWNPFSKKDPNIKTTFEGPDEGVGAKTSWTGNSEVGSGSMTIIDSEPNKLVRLILDFKEPMAVTHNAEYALSEEGAQTRMTWSMSGKSPFFARVICLFMNMDKMVGGEFEKGLASLKTIAETKRQ